MTKAILLGLLLTSSVATTSAQITNSGFETATDTVATLPQGWGARPVRGYRFFLDSTVKHTGTASFHLQSTGETPETPFASFAQSVSLKTDRVQKLTVSAFIKTAGLKGEPGLWCQVRGGADRQIGFANIQNAGYAFGGDADWKKYSLTLVVDSACKRIIPGGYISGTGDIWYDDFSIDTALASAGTSPAAKPVAKFLDRFVHIVRKNSIYASRLDWPTLRRDVVSLSAGMTSVEEAGLVTGYILSKLRAQGDNHSFINSKKQSEQYKEGNVDGRQPTAKMLDGGIAYIYVPGFRSISDTAGRRFGEAIQSLIRGLDSTAAVKGWIVDLRENTGGNMYPMIGGLGPLLGEGTTGSMIDADGKRTKWFYKGGASGAGKRAETKLRNAYTLKAPDAPIAVLIGPRTGSSGEMTAISFIGKPNVRVFGAPSGGYTTANGFFSLSDGSTLLLATSYCADRTGKTYMGKIEPDVTVGAPEDAVKIAQGWIEQP